MRRRLILALAGLVLAAGVGTFAPTEASSSGVRAGSCDLVTIRIKQDQAGRNRLSTPNQGVCAVTEYTGVGVAAGAGQIGSIRFSSPHVDVVCSGGSVRGFSGRVTVTLYGNDADAYEDVSMVVDGASGDLALNPTASAVIQGIRFAAAGTFNRSGSSGCPGDPQATWAFGHITFGDPALSTDGPVPPEEVTRR